MPFASELIPHTIFGYAGHLSVDVRKLWRPSITCHTHAPQKKMLPARFTIYKTHIWPPSIGCHLSYPNQYVHRDCLAMSDNDYLYTSTVIVNASLPLWYVLYFIVDSKRRGGSAVVGICVGHVYRYYNDTPSTFDTTIGRLITSARHVKHHDLPT